MEESKVEEPVIEKSIQEKPIIEESKQKQLKLEESKVEEPVNSISENKIISEHPPLVNIPIPKINTEVKLSETNKVINKSKDAEYVASEEVNITNTIFKSNNLYCFQVLSSNQKAAAESEVKKLINKGHIEYESVILIPRMKPPNMNGE